MVDMATVYRKSPPSLGPTIRKAVFIGLAMTTPMLMKAQVEQILHQNDSSSISPLLRSSYVNMKKNLGQVPANIEFIGTFKTDISKNPKVSLTITKDVSLSIEEQKSLRKEPWLETDGYVFFYIYKIDGEHTGLLSLFKKKQLPQAPSDTLK